MAPMNSDLAASIQSIVDSPEPAVALTMALERFGKTSVRVGRHVSQGGEPGTPFNLDGGESFISVTLDHAGRQVGLLDLAPSRPLSDDEMAEITSLASVAAICIALADSIRRHEKLRGVQLDYLDDFVHDAKTPLTSIIGMAQTLKKRDRLDDAIQDEFINRIEGAARDLEHTIETGRARIHALLDAAGVDFIRCNLVEIVRSVAGDIAVTGPDEVEVMGEPAFIAEMLEATLAHATTRSPGGLQIAVSDGGRIEVSGVPGDADSYGNDIWLAKQAGPIGMSPGDPFELVAPARAARVLGGAMDFEFADKMTIVIELPLV